MYVHVYPQTKSKGNIPLELFMELYNTRCRDTFITIWVTAQKVIINTTQN